MAYYHGVRTSEVETSLITPVQTENNLPFIVGTAPIHLGNSKNVNEPVLCYQYKEFISEFGESTDYDKYTLNEAAYCEYALFNQSQAVFRLLMHFAVAFHLYKEFLSYRGFFRNSKFRHFDCYFKWRD